MYKTEISYKSQGIKLSIETEREQEVIEKRAVRLPPNQLPHSPAIPLNIASSLKIMI